MRKLTSRKFLFTLGTVLIALGSALKGEIEFGQAIIAIVVAVLGYLGVEGAIDYARER